ncbi:MAG TPA: twin-arginine translocase TatA/TatE family subunit [Candidatus Tectomicrobia bacterium]|nr:twin-arginine translocase TatA/TatE family subunit [Candidatus Tectomicrobia bacterium]
MFDIGLQEMLLIGVIALLVFGPSKLPELGRMVGRTMREFRRASEEFRSTVETNLHINDPDPGPTIAPPVEAAPTPVTAPLPSELEAAAAHTAADAPAPEDRGEPFCAQRGSRLFHRRDCAWVARIPQAERASFAHVAEAREQGYTGCPVCDPWEPTDVTSAPVSAVKV